MTAPLQLDGSSLSIADVAAVADGYAAVSLAPAARARMQTTRGIVEELAARGEPVYGVTTGFGNQDFGPFDNEIAGPGNITLGPAPVIENVAVDSMSNAGLLALALVLGLAGFVAVRRYS